MEVTIHISEELHSQVQAKADRQGIDLREACRMALELWVRDDDPDLDEQLRIAREGMKRYRTTLRELAR